MSREDDSSVARVLTHKSGIAREAGGRELKDEAKERRKKGEGEGKAEAAKGSGLGKLFPLYPRTRLSDEASDVAHNREVASREREVGCRRVIEISEESAVRKQKGLLERVA